MNKSIIQELIRCFNGDFKSNIPDDVKCDIYESVAGPEMSNVAKIKFR